MFVKKCQKIMNKCDITNYLSKNCLSKQIVSQNKLSKKKTKKTFDIDLTTKLYVKI